MPSCLPEIWNNSIFLKRSIWRVKRWKMRLERCRCFTEKFTLYCVDEEESRNDSRKKIMIRCIISKSYSGDKPRGSCAYNTCLRNGGLYQGWVRYNGEKMSSPKIFRECNFKTMTIERIWRRTKNWEYMLSL